MSEIDILERNYLAGLITEQEYDEMMEELMEIEND